jgi:hypothetical protein
MSTGYALEKESQIEPCSSQGHWYRFSTPIIPAPITIMIMAKFDSNGSKSFLKKRQHMKLDGSCPLRDCIETTDRRGV